MIHPNGKEGRYLLLKISDEGVGMDNTTRQKIFDPFFTTKDKADGTGMGLSMVFNTVQQHSGFIDVYSEPGVGTTFNVYLPELVNYDSQQEKEDESETLYFGTGSILIIDDELAMRNVFNKILRKCGYTPYLAEDGETGIRVFNEKRETLNLVILDISMPRISGDQVFNKLQEIDPAVPILLTSGFQQDKRVKRIETSRTAGFLQKPFSIFELSKTVYQILNNLPPYSSQ
jgi:CheY-like chemotaxis protein